MSPTRELSQKDEFPQVIRCGVAIMNNDSASVLSDELRLCHVSCVSWSDPHRWLHYFGQAQEILHANITHLEKNDPVRRRVKPDNLSEMADYVAMIDTREDCRWVFGRIESNDAEFSVQHYRNNADLSGWPNFINWYFPPRFAESVTGAKAIRSLFDIGNVALSSFYAYADATSYPASKKKEYGAVNIQAELVGIFWLTYFDAHYESFLGKAKLETLEGVTSVFGNGVTLSLGETPSSVPNGLRNRIESELGPKLFVQPKDVLSKRPGQHALTFEQLRTSIHL